MYIRAYVNNSLHSEGNTNMPTLVLMIKAQCARKQTQTQNQATPNTHKPNIPFLSPTPTHTYMA